MTLTAEDVRILDGFRRLNEQDKATYLKFLTLLVVCPDFSDALKAVTPASAKCPPWEVTERLVAEWVEKVGLAV